ncbi:MAG: FMN-binding protein [Oscillospiraceae bacterium]|nr:FMN-binding protein [Oscillospiraceae bacterium]
MTMKEKLMPPIVLTLICVISSALLVFAYNLTYVDTTGIITDKLSEGLTELYGTSDGFEMLLNENGEVLTYEGVTSVIDNGSGKTAFEIIADGYSKGGLHLLIGFDENGAVSGISVLTIGETPGLGTKVQDSAYLARFKGITSPDFQVDGITGATYSSKGMNKAVETAVKAYSQLKEDKGNG